MPVFFHCRNPHRTRGSVWTHVGICSSGSRCPA
nr:MAG TPA: hypothetical protein [Caudoviricetes sp.]